MKILQGFITDRQYAYLPGRSIHRSLMLTNEILNQMKDAEEAFLLLKLDTIKAFDYLGWEFLYTLLCWLGFGQKFINMIKAINASATSSILIQGRLTNSIQLKRSVRQGFPLSPLLYLLAANAQSMMLTKAADEGKIKGVFVPEVDDQVTHGQFVDDTNVVIVAKCLYVDNLFQIFRTLGTHLGCTLRKGG